MFNDFSVTNLTIEIFESRGSEIKGFLNFELFKILITDHIMSYKPRAELILKEMKERTCSELWKIIGNYFQHFPFIADDLKVNEILLSYVFYI